jgi:mono/diheme cytochrome c family protein
MITLSGVCLLLSQGWPLGPEGWLWAQSPSVATDTASPRWEAASRQFAHLCARCHGSDYRGSPWHQNGRPIPDFTSGAWHERHTDAQLLVSILEGKGTAMPAFTGRVSREQARDLVLLIRRANPTRRTTPQAGATDFHERYTALCEELNDLRKQFRMVPNPSARPETKGPEPGAGRRNVRGRGAEKGERGRLLPGLGE